MNQNCSAPLRDPDSVACQCRADRLIARVAHAKRAVLLRHYRGRLCREALEDAYSQAVLEILIVARRRALTDERHIGNVIEQRFRSRVIDRIRAIRGRSPIEHALAHATRLGACGKQQWLGLPDPYTDVEVTVIALEDLRRIASAMSGGLSEVQAGVLAHSAGGGRCEEFIARLGRTEARYRKVHQRGRARLRRRLATAVDVPGPRSELHECLV